MIAFDTPPFGFSDRAGDYTRSRQALGINDVLEKFETQCVIIVGHSFGAGAATESRRLKIAVTMLWGEEDTVTQMERAKGLRQRLVQGTLTVPPGLGHIPKIEDSDAFNAALLKAIGSF